MVPDSQADVPAAPVLQINLENAMHYLIIKKISTIMLLIFISVSALANAGSY